MPSEACAGGASGQPPGTASTAPALPALVPQWPAPPCVGALMSRRAGGVSTGRYASLNLGLSVGDDPLAVAENRRRFAAALGAAPVWLRQVHGVRAVRIGRADISGEPIEADAAWTDEAGVACTVQVADCLPVLLAVADGRAVAAAHAGWRGLAGGIVEATLDALCAGARCTPDQVVAWLGPCIGPARFQVGAEVLQAFGVAPGSRADSAFAPGTPRDGSPRWLADLPRLARERLQRAGVTRVAGGTWCTVDDASGFFSHRRDGVSGRLAAAVWIRG